MPIADLTDRSLPDLLSLDGRVAVVTGGALGIGAAISRRLGEAGATVVVADIDAAAGSTTAKRLVEAGVDAIALDVDVRSVAAVEALAEAVVADRGRIDVWVNNAGIYPNVPLMEVSSDDWDRVMEINVRGAFAGARAAARQMIARGEGGVIINLSSINGYRAFGPGITHYTASKHALLGLTKSLAMELGTQDIRVVAIAPTMIETEGVAVLRDGNDSDEIGDALDAFGAQHPLGRVGQPDDVARVALFCALDLAGYVSGDCIAVDGGFLAA
jgi:NAD(P)-dependent dehydrogenase (short-subunit alcohol dehydrogenase family)